MMSTSDITKNWRTPFVILMAGTAIVFLSLGARMTFGLWMPDASTDLFGGQIEILSLSIALQSLFWGIGTPIAGNIADKYGTGRVIAAAGILYTAGLLLMTVSTSPIMAHLSIGVFTGLLCRALCSPLYSPQLAEPFRQKNGISILGSPARAARRDR